MLCVVSYGAAAASNARVWRVYRDRATGADNDLIEGWYDTLNTLLIFVRVSLSAYSPIPDMGAATGWPVFCRSHSISR